MLNQLLKKLPVGINGHRFIKIAIIKQSEDLKIKFFTNIFLINLIPITKNKEIIIKNPKIPVSANSWIYVL